MPTAAPTPGTPTAIPPTRGPSLLGPGEEPRDRPQPWPATPDAPDVHGTIGCVDAAEGDLVFCARPGVLQSLCTRAGEPWRHVGMAVEHHGELCIAEVAGDRFGLRPLAGLVERYESVAVGRVREPDRAAAVEAARWTAEHSGHEQVYAWDDLILAGLIGVSRCHVGPHDEAVLERSLRAAASAMADRPLAAGDRGYTCSSFVATALARAGLDPGTQLTASRRRDHHQPSLLDLVRRRQRPLRAGHGTRITGHQIISLTSAVTMALIAATTGLTGTADLADASRWITPGDLWRSDVLSHRWYLAPPPPVPLGRDPVIGYCST